MPESEASHYWVRNLSIVTFHYKVAHWSNTLPMKCDSMNYFIIVLFVLCTLIFRPCVLNAQETPNAISIDLFLPIMSPLSRMLGEEASFVPINVKYKRMLAEHYVLTVKMGVTNNWDSEGEHTVEVSPMLAVDWHPFSSGMTGFYLGPSLFYSHSLHSYSRTTVEDDLDYSYWAAAGGNIGYEFAFQSGIVIDLIFGLGYGYLKEVEIGGRTLSSDMRVDETIGGVYVGYSF